MSDYARVDLHQTTSYPLYIDPYYAKRFDTLGEVATFMLVGHPCFHLGQISAWRRIVGMNHAS